MPKINRPPQDGFIGSVKSHNNRLSYLERSVATSTPGARVTGATNSVANGGTGGIVNFTTVTYAFSPMTVSGAQITAPVTGVYSAKVYVEFGAIASGQANFYIQNVTQSTNEQLGYATTNERSFFASDDIQANAGDVLQIGLNNSTGGTLTFTANSYFTLTYVSSGSAAVATGSAGTTSVSSPITNTGTGSSPIIGLSTAGASSQQVLGYNGTTWVPATRTVSPGRFMIIGHSYAAPPADPYEYSGYSNLFGNTSAGTSNFQRMYPSLLRNMLGMGRNTDNVIVTTVPSVSGTTSTTTLLGTLPEEAWIDFCHFVPNSTTGLPASPNGRYYSLQVAPPTSNSWTTIGYSIANSTWQAFGLAAGGPVVLNSFSSVFGSLSPSPKYGFRNSSGAYVMVSTSQIGAANVSWTSTALGTGGTDPGGLVYVRFNTRFRNYSVAGSQIAVSGVYQGGWATFFAFRPRSQSYYYMGNNAFYAGLVGEVNVTATASIGATTISCDPLVGVAPGQTAISSGVSITFAVGNNTTVTAITTAVASAGATSISVSALSAAVPAGSSGFAKSGSTGGYESLIGIGMSCIVHGINDCNIGPFDVSAFKETTRAIIANASCAYMSNATQANIQYVNGNGGGTWTTHIQPAAGQFWNPQSFDTSQTTFTPTGSVKMFSGAVGTSTPTTIKINIPPAFEGGAVDLFFLALGGSNNGGAATITVDGATFNGGTTISTNSVSPTANQKTVTCSISGTTLTATSGTFSNPGDIGTFVVDTTTPANIPAGTYITTTDGTGATNTNIPSATTTTSTISSSGTTATGQVLTLLGFVPMVKRLTGLTAGAHTITVTLNSMGSGAVPRFLFYGYGIESSNTISPDLSASIAMCNIPHTPGTASANTNITTANTAIAAVLNGTATGVSGNSTEPSLNTQAFLVDIDTALGWNGSSVGTQNFSFDGLHPNARGHALIANAIYNGMILATGVTPINLAVTAG
jgi:hypothetical protein